MSACLRIVTERVGIDKQLAGQIDPLLGPLLPPAKDDEAREYLSQLIAAYATPVIKGVIRYKLHLPSHDGAGQADADDLRQETVLQLVEALQRFRQGPDEHPINDLRGLAAVIAHRTCSLWMRRQYPGRHALKNRLYYLLTRYRGFALWKDEHRKLLAGFANWRGQQNAAGREPLEQLSDNEGLVAQIRLLTAGKQNAGLSDALAAVFSHLNSPVEFDSLVGALVPLMPNIDQPVESTDQDGGCVIASATTGEPTPAWRVEKRIFLERVWEEVRLLPRNQRAALLLNLRDPRGGGCIALFPATGVATFRQLAEALQLTVEQLAEIWNNLPLEDSHLAGLLQISRQQVINARKSARERLARKLKGFI